MKPWPIVLSVGCATGLTLLLGLPGPWLRVEGFLASRTRVDAATSRHSDLVRQSRLAGVFWGVDSVGDPEASCHDLKRAVATLPHDEPPPIADRAALMRYLEDAHPPSLRGSPLWLATGRSVERTREWLLSQELPVSLGSMVRFSARDAGGTSLGILTAHNLVKELTLSGRRFRPDQLPESTSRLAATLRPWRRSPQLPSGGYDRLGPLYHALAALTLVIWTHSETLGVLAADYEAARRIARIGQDHPDPEKAQADRCGVEAGTLLIAGRR